MQSLPADQKWEHGPARRFSPNPEGYDRHYHFKIAIGGTHYTGEIKKSIYTELNHILPDKSVFQMQCSANVGAAQTAPCYSTVQVPASFF